MIAACTETSVISFDDSIGCILIVSHLPSKWHYWWNTPPPQLPWVTFSDGRAYGARHGVLLIMIPAEYVARESRSSQVCVCTPEMMSDRAVGGRDLLWQVKYRTRPGLFVRLTLSPLNAHNIGGGGDVVVDNGKWIDCERRFSTSRAAFVRRDGSLNISAGKVSYSYRARVLFLHFFARGKILEVFFSN